MTVGKLKYKNLWFYFDIMNNETPAARVKETGDRLGELYPISPMCQSPVNITLCYEAKFNYP